MLYNNTAMPVCWNGRRGGLKIRWANNPCGFDPRHRHQKNVVFAGLCHGDQRFEYLFRILSQCRRQFYAGVLSGCLFPAAVYIGNFRLVQHADRIGFDDFFFCHNRYSPLSVTMV